MNGIMVFLNFILFFENNELLYCLILAKVFIHFHITALTKEYSVTMTSKVNTKYFSYETIDIN